MVGVVTVSLSKPERPEADDRDTEAEICWKLRKQINNITKRGAFIDNMKSRNGGHVKNLLKVRTHFGVYTMSHLPQIAGSF